MESRTRRPSGKGGAVNCPLKKSSRHVARPPSGVKQSDTQCFPRGFPAGAAGPHFFNGQLRVGAGRRTSSRPLHQALPPFFRHKGKLNRRLVGELRYRELNSASAGPVPLACGDAVGGARADPRPC